MTENYPANLNGSPNSITAVTSESGRATILDAHLERVFRTVSNSAPGKQGEIQPGCGYFPQRAANSWAKNRLQIELSLLPTQGFYFQGVLRAGVGDRRQTRCGGVVQMTFNLLIHKGITESFTRCC